METDIKRLQSFYQKYITEYPNGGGWPNLEVAFESYQTCAMSSLIPWQSLKKITDVGSGVGNFLPFIRTEYNYLNQYLGIEIVDFFYKSSTLQFSSDPLAKFIHSDFLNVNFEEVNKADWVFCIGALGTVQNDKKEYDIEFIRKLRSIANLGMTLHVNDDKYFSKERLREIPDLYAHNVTDILKFIKNEFDYRDLEITNYPKTDHTSCAINILFH